MKGKRKSKKFKHFILYVSMLMLSAVFVLGGLKQISMTQQLRSSIQKKENEKKALTSKKKELEKTKRNLTNPDYVEYIARGKYLVTKGGEQVFKFPSKDDSN